MDERHKTPRKYLIIYSRVFHRENGTVIGYLSDLNKLGAMLISDDPQPTGITLPLRFDLPEPHLFGSPRFSLNAKVAWCSPDIDPSFYNIGLEFGELSPTQAKIIEEMMVAYEFRRDSDAQPPIFPTTTP